jgi:outer membrane protein insertion porin family
MALYRFLIGGLVAALLMLGPAAFASGAESGGSPAKGGHSGTRSSSDWQITLAGNRSIAEAKLLGSAREELEQFANQGHAASAIDDAAFQMELLYRHAGYPQAVVDYEIKPEGRQVVFQVQEGKRLMLRDFVFAGNHAISRDRLLALAPAGIIKSLGKKHPFPYVAETVSDLVGSIRTLYLSEGYLQVEVKASPPLSPAENPNEPADVTVTVHEGPRFTVGEIEVSGDQPSDLTKKIAAIVKSMRGIVYQRRQNLVLRTKLHDSYENAGYADVKVAVEEEVDDKRGLVRLRAKVESGRRFVVDKIVVTGNDRTSADFIISRLKLKPGTRYTLDDKRDSFSALYKTGLFSSVDLTLTDSPVPGRKIVAVKVQERKAREVYVEPGWGSYELLRLKMGYKDSNLFGTGRILRLDSAASVMGRSLEAGVSDPWFLGSDWTVGMPFHYRYRTEPSFTLENSGVDLVGIKTIHKNVTVNLDYQYSKNILSDVAPDANLEGLDSNYNIASLTCQVTRDTRNDLFFPSTGYRGNVSLAVARPEFGGTISYERFITGVSYFIPLSGGSIVGLRFNTGVILPSGDQQSIPVSERFFNGGENSVRSFQESKIGPRDSTGNPLGGTASSTLSVEWRKKLTEDFAWSLFADIGNVSPNRTTVDGQSPLLALDSAALIRATWRDYLSDLRSGIGTGVQYMLPVGPARLDVAVNPDPDPELHEADYAVHFSIGMAF